MVLENLVNTGSGNGLALRHQAITWTNVDLSPARCSGIHLSAILQEIPQPSVTEISSKITYLKLCSNLPGANELIEPVMAKRNDAYIRHKASAICLKYYPQNTHRMGCCIFNQWMRMANNRDGGEQCGFPIKIQTLTCIVYITMGGWEWCTKS